MAPRGDSSRINRAPRWMWVVSVALVVSLAGALGVVRATNSALDGVTRLTAVDAVLSPPSDTVENILLVGSDSRAGADPSDEDFATTGSEDATPGMRSDTLILVRIGRDDGSVSMMSIPRDLWVRVGDTDKYAKVNATYADGPDVLVRTIQRALNIPVHHYIEIDFSGFKTIVDAIGGVPVCVVNPSRDKNTGFRIARPGCKRLDGSQALGYARSRYFEEKIDGKWVLDRTGDTGRGERQRAFMTTLVKETLRHLARNPMRTHEVLGAATSVMSVSSGLDLLDAGKSLRPLGAGDALSYALPVSSDMLNDNFVFRLSRDASPMLAFFAGLGPAPGAAE